MPYRPCRGAGPSPWSSVRRMDSGRSNSAMAATGLPPSTSRRFLSRSTPPRGGGPVLGSRSPNAWWRIWEGGSRCRAAPGTGRRFAFSSRRPEGRIQRPGARSTGRVRFVEAAMPRILIVDDEAGMRGFLSILLERGGFEGACAKDGEEDPDAVRKAHFDLIISDLKMPAVDGVRLLDGVQKLRPETPVILITAHASAESAIEAMKLGAFDYLTKPFRVEEIRPIIARALEAKASRVSGVLSWSGEAFPSSVEGLIGRSAKMIELYKLISKVAAVSGTVLIIGESGTGKELVARTIHKNSARTAKPFMAISCGAIPETLLESELFGHVKGAFTGAVAAKAGLFEVADKGTVFLDEIGETSPAIQVKLLRVLQERVFRRVGGTEDVEVDVRVIAATHQDLMELIHKERFREDLYYRLNVIPIHLPPLRERREDIPLLAMNFLAKYSEENKRPIQGIAPEAMELFLGYYWPGNVRALGH